MTETIDFVDAHDTIEAARLSSRIERDIFGGWATLVAVDRWVGTLNRPLPKNMKVINR